MLRASETLVKYSSVALSISDLKLCMPTSVLDGCRLNKAIRQIGRAVLVDEYLTVSEHPPAFYSGFCFMYLRRLRSMYINNLKKDLKEPKYDICCAGRSMIEMLGVLAIIAVLSVGGIAGYSKAMQIYKLNKWKEDFITLTANLKIAFINSRSYTDIEENDLTNFYKELNIVPQGMLTSSNQDIFGNKFTLFARHNPQWNLNTVHFTIQIDTLPNSFSVEECKTVFELAQHYDDNWSVVLNQNISGLNGILRICGKSLPKEFAQNVSCQQYNVTTIAKKCSVCGKQNCDIKFVINNCS